MSRKSSARFSAFGLLLIISISLNILFMGAATFTAYVTGQGQVHDINGNCKVDIFDLVMVAKQFGQNQADGTTCDDGNSGTINDQCLAGACTGQACTPQAETCNGLDDDCDGSVDEGSLCSDGLYCNGVETCSSGSCKPAVNPCPGPDGDADCTESCNETNDSCTANDPEGSLCEGGKHCNGSGLCI